MSQAFVFQKADARLAAFEAFNCQFFIQVLFSPSLEFRPQPLRSITLHEKLVKSRRNLIQAVRCQFLTIH